MERNGIDTELLEGFIDTMARVPDGGLVTVRTRHRWDTGFAVDAIPEELAQFGQGMVRTHHSYRTDWPAPLAEDSGPTPGAEGVVAAVGACVATTYVAAAARQGVTIQELEVVAEGSVDLQTVFSAEPEGTGIQGIQLTLRVVADTDDDVLEGLADLSTRTSPAFGALANPIPVALQVERADA